MAYDTAARTGWTEERVDRLKLLWKQGLSSSEIGERLGGFSRNAVIGKVHRLGLEKRREPTVWVRGATIDARRWTPERDGVLIDLWNLGLEPCDIAERLCRSVASVHGRVKALRNLGFDLEDKRGGDNRSPEQKIPPKLKSQPVRKVRREDEPESLKISLQDLTRQHCRWITSDHGPAEYCGHTVKEGSPYCPHHTDRARAPRRQA